jgi:hypothetical protein
LAKPADDQPNAISSAPNPDCRVAFLPRPAPGRLIQASKANAPIVEMVAAAEAAVIELAFHRTPDGSETTAGPGWGISRRRFPAAEIT